MIQWLKKCLVMAFGVLATVQPAWAQAPGKAAEEESSWLVWAVFVGAGLLILATGFMNPKRSHLN